MHECVSWVPRFIYGINSEGMIFRRQFSLRIEWKVTEI